MEEAMRLREPNRKQLILQPTEIDGLSEAEQPARAIWRVPQKLDLGQFCAGIKAREGLAGRAANHPRMRLAWWLYAISQGVNSACELERRCRAHAAYRWSCSGISVNYRSLSDFRSAHHGARDELMSQVLAALLERGVLCLERVAQDGTRVRASAGAASFRRKARLRACPQGGARTSPPGRPKRAAAEREQRLEQALAQLKQREQRRAQAKNHPQRSNPARASSTDPEARVMKMANGGFNPA